MDQVLSCVVISTLHKAATFGCSLWQYPHQNANVLGVGFGKIVRSVSLPASFCVQVLLASVEKHVNQHPVCNIFSFC